MAIMVTIFIKAVVMVIIYIATVTMKNSAIYRNHIHNNCSSRSSCYGNSFCDNHYHSCYGNSFYGNHYHSNSCYGNHYLVI